MNRAVAIKYLNNLPAPFIIGKGKNRLADQLVRIAAEHDITIMEMPELADSLFTLETGTFIPEEYFKIIAELLVFVSGIRVRK